MTFEINQILPALVYGDAIGNHAYELWKLLRRWGIKSTILAGYIDPRYAHAGRDYRAYKGNPKNILIYHYSIGSQVTSFIQNLADRVVLYYHNITPAHFFRGINQQFEQELVAGRNQLRSLQHLPDVVAASDYNRIELEQVGFRNVEVLPYLVDFSRLDRGADTPSAAKMCRDLLDGRRILLFVGRIAPNKCQHDLVHLMRYYHKCIDPDTRLLLVGHSSNAAVYQLQLDIMVQRLELTHHVTFAGQVGTDDGLGALYQAAHAFVCMSEHEGFCVPIIESMHYGLPVVAYRSTGVPYTLGSSGVLFTQKRNEYVAEVLHLLNEDQRFRSTIIMGQNERLKAFQADVVAERFRELLLRWQVKL
ncbi:MAG: glycosyltransferase family 4 protein [Chloroflexi bacterium]|nr:glycosyltransferase family 4 protein [Chloroflexota bacterium]MCL5275877.1 glycosyltransferase family 4 protein [Chloroflexota bacterium]